VPTTPVHIEDAARVVRAFGRWPSFHDAELREVRREGDGVLVLTLRAFMMTSELDARGYFVQMNPHDVRLRFEDVAEERLSMAPDTLMQLRIDDERDLHGRFLVHVDSAVGTDEEGFGGTFRARSGRVVDVSPCAADGA